MVKAVFNCDFERWMELAGFEPMTFQLSPLMLGSYLHYWNLHLSVRPSVLIGNWYLKGPWSEKWSNSRLTIKRSKVRPLFSLDLPHNWNSCVDFYNYWSRLTSMKIKVVWVDLIKIGNRCRLMDWLRYTWETKLHDWAVLVQSFPFN